MSTRNYSSRWTATFLAEPILPENAIITAVSVVAFTETGKFIAILQPRGLCIPGGHIESEETPEQAVYREALEEAAISQLGELTLTSVIR